jgi:hypothetical protein
MVSAETLTKTILSICTAAIIYFIVFVWKLPIPCVGCEPIKGLYYRCITGGAGTATCSLENATGTGNTGALRNILKQLVDFGVKELPRDIINVAVSIKTQIVNLGNKIMNGIKSTINTVRDKLKEYINVVKQFVLDGAAFVKNSIIIPMIQGIVNYIINPVKELVKSIISLRGVAIEALKSAYGEAKKLTVTIVDLTYGNVVYGFDQIPEGLVSFVEMIQNALNTLKNGIIGGANSGVNAIIGFVNSASNFLMSGIKSAIQGTEDVVNILGKFADDIVYGIMDGAKSALNTIIFGGNWFIEAATHPFIYLINYISHIDWGKDVIGAGVDTLTGGINSVFAPLLYTIVGPVINAFQAIGDAVVGTINSISTVDLGGQRIDFGFSIAGTRMAFTMPHIRPFTWMGGLTMPRLGTVTEDTFKIPSVKPNIPSFCLGNCNPSVGNIAYLENVIPYVNFDPVHICDDPNRCVSFADSANAGLPGDDPIKARDVIPNPEDLFWAGKRKVPLSQTILTSTTDAQCQRICASNNFQSSTVFNGNCVCSKFEVNTNIQVGVQSCTDVCFNFGGVTSCGACPNEIVAENPSVLKYTFTSPETIFTSTVLFPLNTYTPALLCSTLNTLLVDDINLNTTNVNTKKNAGLTSNSFSFTVQNGLINLTISNTDPKMVNTTLTLFFSKNPMMATNFGFTTVQGTTVTSSDALFAPGQIVTSTSSPYMTIQSYKGWAVFNYSEKNIYPSALYYIYLSPKLMLLQSGTTALPSGGYANETTVTAADLANYNNMGMFYTNANGERFILGSQNIGYSINTGSSPVQISGTPSAAGYTSNLLSSGMTTYTKDNNTFYIYDSVSILYPIGMDPNVVVGFGPTPILAGYTQKSLPNGKFYFNLNGINYIYDRTLNKLFPFNMSNPIIVPKGRMLTKPPSRTDNGVLTYINGGDSTQGGQIVFSKTSLGQWATSNPVAPTSAIEVFTYGANAYLYDPPGSKTTADAKGYLYPITNSPVTLKTTLAEIDFTATTLGSLTSVYKNSANNYYYFDRKYKLYPLSGGAALYYQVTPANPITNYTRNTLPSGFVYYTINGYNYVFDNIATLYLLNPFEASPPTFFGSPLNNGYMASSVYGHVLNGNTYSFYGVPTTFTLIRILSTSDCGAACGSNELIVSYDPSVLTYGFVNKDYNFRSIINFPLYPVDINGNLYSAPLITTNSYTQETFRTTLIYLLTQDMKKQMPDYNITSELFNFSYLSITNKYRLAFNTDLFPKIGLATFTLYTTLNPIMASHFGSSNVDVCFSTDTFPVSPYPITTTTITATTNTFSYQFIDPTYGYNFISSITIPATTYTASFSAQFGQYVSSALSFDINLNTKNVYNLTASAFSFTYSASTGKFTIYTVTLLPNVYIKLLLNRNAPMASLFGFNPGLDNTGAQITPLDMSIFTVYTIPPGFYQSLQSIALCIFNYKGYNLYQLNGAMYFYIAPKMFTISGGTTSCPPIMSCSETIVTSLSKYTPVTFGSTTYYVLIDPATNLSTPYMLTEKKGGYELDSAKGISVENLSVLTSKYKLVTTPNGLNYYQDESISSFVISNQNTLIQIENNPIPNVTMPVNPNSLNYTFDNGLISFTSKVTFPGLDYVSADIGPALASLLVNDINANGGSISPEDISIVLTTPPTPTPSPTPAPNTTPRPNVTPAPPSLDVGKMIFSGSSPTTPFIINLKFSENSILQSNFGVTTDVVIISTKPATESQTNARVSNPYKINYTFKDQNFSFPSSIILPTPFTYNTPDAFVTILINLLVADINRISQYKYTPGAFSFVFNNSTKKYTISVNPQNSFSNSVPATIVLKFTTDANVVPTTILPNVWANALGFVTDLTITSVPVISAVQVPTTIRNPMAVNYTCTDITRRVSINSQIVIPDSIFSGVDVIPDITASLNALLLADLNSKQSIYSLTSSSINITYQPSTRVFSFGFGVGAPLSLTFQFSTTSALALNFGCTNDISFVTTDSFISPIAAVDTYGAHNGLDVWTITQRPCVYKNNAFYPFVFGSQSCTFGNCVETNVLTNADLAVYTLNGEIYSKRGDNFIFNASYNVLYPIYNTITPTVALYGKYADSGYSEVSICTLDKKGNCIAVDPTSVPMAKNIKTSKLYAFVTVEKSLVKFTTNSTTITQCPCQITSTIIPTCDQICKLGRDRNGQPLKCFNPKETGGAPACGCFETGAVNVIIEPMQTYNPFRLLGAAVVAGGKELHKGISYVVQNFLTPLWEVVKLVISFIASIITMIVQFIIQYAKLALEGVKGILKGGNSNDGIVSKLKAFVNNTIMPALKSIWSIRHIIIDGITSIASKIWTSVIGVLKKISEGFISLLKVAVSAILDGLLYAWNFLWWIIGVTVENLTMFIPIPKPVKMSLLIIGIIYVALVAGWKALNKTYYDAPDLVLEFVLEPLWDQAINFFSRMYAVTQDLISGSSQG